MSRVRVPTDGAQSRGDDVRLRRALGLLARPELCDRDIRRLKWLISRPKWKPVPRIPSVNVLEPLFFNHFLRAGLDPEVVLRRPCNVVLPHPTFVDLVHTWNLHRAEITSLARAIEESGASRAMLFKGAAIAPLYPNPALRQMADIDLIAEGQDLQAVREKLKSIGWTCSRTTFGETWSLKGAILRIDLHEPADPVAQEILANAVPAAAILSSAKVLTVPEPSDHLVLVAVHAADNAGNRLWRDISDAQSLIACGASGVGALSRASGTRALPPVEAFLAFLSRWCGCESLPREPSTREGRRLLALFEASSVQAISPVQLELMGAMFYDAPLGLVRRALGGGRRPPLEHSTAVERDPTMGTLPRPGTWARTRLRLSILLTYARSRRLPALAALAFRQARMRKNRRLFDTPRH